MINQEENESIKKSNKENISNNISKVTSEKKSQIEANSIKEDEEQKKDMPEEEEISEYVFKVIKLGRRGFSHKERILYVSPKGIAYYEMLKHNRYTKEFLGEVSKIYSSTSYEDKALAKFKNLADLFKRIPDTEKKLKGSFDNYILNNTDSESVSQKGNTITVYDALNKDYTNTDNFWILDAGDEIIKSHIFRASMKVIQAIDEMKKNKENKKQIKLNRTDNKLNKKTETIQKDKLSTDKMELITDLKDKIKYIGIMYQGFMKEYLKVYGELIELNKILVKNPEATASSLLTKYTCDELTTKLCVSPLKFAPPIRMAIISESFLFFDLRIVDNPDMFIVFIPLFPKIPPSDVPLYVTLSLLPLPHWKLTRALPPVRLAIFKFN